MATYIHINSCGLLFTSFYIFKTLGHIFKKINLKNHQTNNCHPVFRLAWSNSLHLCPPTCSSMPCLRAWRPSPRGQPTLPSKCAAWHVVATATLAAAPCQTFTSSSHLRAPTRERTRSWCCRLQGNSSDRNVWRLSRTKFTACQVLHPILTQTHTRNAFLLLLLLCC